MYVFLCQTKKNMNKDLIKFLQEKQEKGQWLEIANQFNVLGTSKQKSDYVRRLWKKIKKEKDVVNFVQVQGEKNFSDIDWVTTSSNSSWTIDEGNPYLQLRISRKESVKKSGIHIVLGCVHVPFHNKVLLNKLLDFIEDQKDNIIGFHLIGDFMDMKSLSSHDDKTIDLSGLTLGKEYQEGNNVLDLLDEVLPDNIQKTFLYGNHEDRYLRHISNIKNYKTADAIQSPEQALNLNQRGYIVKNDWKEGYVTIGKYQLLHGISLTVNSCKTHVEKLRSSCIFAHTHKVGQYYEGWLHGVNIGHFGDENSKGFSYLSRVERAPWKNGFGIISISGKHSQAETVVCEDNGFFYNGKRY